MKHDFVPPAGASIKTTWSRLYEVDGRWFVAAIKECPPEDKEKLKTVGSLLRYLGICTYPEAGREFQRLMDNFTGKV